jgi:hypothetical protein
MCHTSQDSDNRINGTTKLYEKVLMFKGNTICANHEFMLNKLCK